MDQLLDLFVFSENNPISSPFYCSRLGSKTYKGCLQLFFKIILVQWSAQKMTSDSITSLLMAQVSRTDTVLSLEEDLDAVPSASSKDDIFQDVKEQSELQQKDGVHNVVEDVDDDDYYHYDDDDDNNDDDDDNDDNDDDDDYRILV